MLVFFIRLFCEYAATPQNYTYLHTLALHGVLRIFCRLPVHCMGWPALCSLVVGLGGWLEPRALGVGYDVIGDLLANDLALHVVVALVLVKAVIWVVALGSGTSGGLLAPLLMIGAGLGCVLGPWLPGGETGRAHV